MKNLRLIVLMAVMVIIIAACSSNPTPTTAPTLPVDDIATVVEPVASAGELTDAEMEALITEKIGKNHTLDFILSQDKTAEEWSTTLDKMISYGADINAEEKALIIAWLTSRK